MGCQLNAGNYQINYSNGAFLVIALTDKWYDKKRDGEWDVDRYLGISRIDNNSIKEADKEIPLNYINWLNDNHIKVTIKDYGVFSKNDFTIARDFISEVAKTDLNVNVSM